MDELESIWPDEDFRNDALGRLASTINEKQEPTELRPSELRVLIAASHGLSMKETAEVLGVEWMTVRDEGKRLRRILGAKNMAHAVAIGLRRGLIT